MKKIAPLLLAFIVTGLISEAKAAVSIPLTVHLSEIVFVTGSPRIAVDVGGVTRYALYSTGSGSNTLTFTLTPEAGDVDLDGVSVASPIDLNSGTLKDQAGNDIASLSFTPPNTTGIKVNNPSLGLDFIYDSDGRYTNGTTVYNDLTSFLAATGGSFTRPSIATYFDATGTLQTAASGVPRFDYDPVTHTSKGLLLEETRTNIVKYSSQLETTWSKSNLTISANSATAPDGTMTADKIIETTTASSSHVIFQNTGTGTLSSSYTVSVFIKAAERTKGAITFMGYTNWQGGTPEISFDLSLGSILTTGTTTQSSIRPVGNGWYYITMTSVMTTAAAVTPAFVIRDDTNNGVYTGDGSSGLYIWGAQVEQAGLASSYIPTTSAAVARSPDYLSIPTASWYNAPSGTLWASGIYDAVGSTTSRGLLYCDDGTPNSAIGFYLGDNLSPRKMGIQVMYSGSGQVSAYSAAYTTGSTISAALAYQTNDVIGSFNGVLTALDTSATIPTCSRLIVGNLRGNWGNITGHVLKARYYPARVPNSQLSLMTQ